MEVLFALGGVVLALLVIVGFFNEIFLATNAISFFRGKKTPLEYIAEDIGKDKN